ncbi:MAG TPA: hypothetical protein GXZ51_02530 [Acholeplasma sp.]|nr:hypothetical protein [Acholeplasma sp.]
MTACKDDPKITISKTNVSLEVGESITIDYTIDPVDTKIDWSTDNPAMVSVSDGKVTV